MTVPSTKRRTRRTKKFIMDVVDETWYKELEDPETFYTNVTAIKIFEHLTKLCLGIHTMGAIYIPKLMKTIFTNAEVISQFINLMEAAHQKSKRAKLEIQDECMHDVALKFLIKYCDYETETREWSKIPNDQQTWMAWKTTFRDAYVAKWRDKAVRQGKEKTFGGAVADEAQDQQCFQGNIVPAALEPLSDPMLDSLEGYLVNIATATNVLISRSEERRGQVCKQYIAAEGEV